MKKFFIAFIAILMVSFTVCNAQSLVKPLKAGEYQYYYGGASTDTIGAGTTSWYKDINPGKDDALFYVHQVKLINVSGTSNVPVTLYGKYIITDTAWTSIATVTFTGAVPDTVINFTELSTRKIWNYYRLKGVRVNGVTKFSWIKSYFKK